MAAFAMHLPWYATGFRKDDMAAALDQISELSLRYGATRYTVYQSQDDLYKFLQVVEFDSKADWESYWFSPEFTEMRAATQGWYQVPILYTPNRIVAYGELTLDGETPAPAEA